MNYLCLSGMILDRQNLPAFTEEMGIFHGFLQLLILGRKIDTHDMFFHSAGAIPIGFKEHTFLVQEIMQFFPAPRDSFSHRAFLIIDNHGKFFVG